MSDVPDVPGKKATDILLDLDKKVDEILLYLRNTDLKVALILNKLNLSSSAPEPINPAPIKQVNNTTKAVSKFAVPSDLKQKLQTAIEEAKRDTFKSDEVTFHEVKEKTHPDQIRQIPVQQRIVFADGKSVYMATVIIYQNGEFVKQTKTNQMGKWITTLPSGKYQVKISKSGTQIKPKVELDYFVEIPNQDSAVQLNERIVG